MFRNIVAFFTASAILAALASAPASASIVLYDGDYSVEAVFRLPAQQSQSGISFGGARLRTRPSNHGRVITPGSPERQPESINSRLFPVSVAS